MLKFPMVAVNDADCKHLFDNRYGTGQSVWDSIMRNTNLVVASKTVVVAGYGWCSRGIAMRAAALGAQIIVTEVNPIRAMEARMDGYSVMTMEKAAVLGDIFVTATGCKGTIPLSAMEKMKNGAILCNADENKPAMPFSLYCLTHRSPVFLEILMFFEALAILSQ